MNDSKRLKELSTACFIFLRRLDEIGGELTGKTGEKIGLKWLWTLTGGRPMKCLDRCQFRDVVSGKQVGLYQDRLGRHWLSDHILFSSFRVRVDR